MRKASHVKLGYMDVPIEYTNFNEEQKLNFCNLMIDRMLMMIERELKYAPEINRIDFLDSILDSSLETNEQHEAYEVCQVIYDMKKQLALDN